MTGVEHFVREWAGVTVAGRRRGVLLGAAAPELGTGPPAYLKQIAERHGVCLDRYQWGLAADGDYSSRKLLFLLAGPGQSKPEYVVKMVRSPRFNKRLRAEADALRKLPQLGFAGAEALPQLAFEGDHGGLSIVGESYVDGLPFRERSRRSIDCPHAARAIDWLTDLAKVPGEPASMASAELAEGFQIMLNRFCRLFRPSKEHACFLAGQLQVLRESTARVPVVFQHGDPGCWNVQIRGDDEIVFLDWEAAKACGIPAWDLFYFLRSFFRHLSPGRRDDARLMPRIFLGQHSWNSLFRTTVRRYCQDIDLSSELVEPLFYFCWAHRALKETTRMPREQLWAARYYRFLIRCIEEQRRLPVGRLPLD